MFLISAHQTYLNNKLLKERLSSNSNRRNSTNSPISNATTDQEDVTSFYCASRKFLASEDIDILKAKTKESNSLLMTIEWIPTKRVKYILSKNPSNNSQEIKAESRLMQRTRKYFTTNGHKFLFNNT